MIDQTTLKSHMTASELQALDQMEERLDDILQRLKVMEAQLVQVHTNLRALQAVKIPTEPGPNDDTRNFPKFDFGDHRRRIKSAQERYDGQHLEFKTLQGDQTAVEHDIEQMYAGMSKLLVRAQNQAHFEDLVASLRQG